jgi:CheY-like chemotaxis protein
MGAIRLLVVDDEGPLLSLLKRYLERLGYEVDLADTAEAALEMFEIDPRRYVCVLTDLTLPKMNGEELIDRLREHNPQLPALISSGYPYEVKPGKSKARTGFLQKPYVPQMLVEALIGLLGRKPGAN